MTSIKDPKSAYTVTVPTLEHLLSAARVTSITTLPRPSIYALMLRGDFPRPVKLGGPKTRRVAWKLSDISAWVESRVPASQA